MLDKFRALPDTKRLIIQGQAQIVLLALILAAVLWDGGLNSPEGVASVGALAAAVIYALKSLIPKDYRD